MITIKHLSKKFNINGRSIEVLTDVNCEIKKGEVISIIGPSGTGKSTFLRCINCLETPTSGEIIVDGQNILSKNFNLPKLRRKMGMVFQNFNLFEKMTILENVTVGPIKLLGTTKEDAVNEGLKLLDMVGMNAKANSYPHELSGGQKQRVAIARCLSMKPEIILFDEPTSALDPTMVSEVLSVIRKLAKEGMTMAIVTHEMKFAHDVSNRIFFMCDGIIYEEGTPDHIFYHPDKQKTREFIYKLRIHEIEFTDKNNDLIAVNNSLTMFCLKYAISRYDEYRIELIIEELVKNIMPFSGNVHIQVIYSESNFGLRIIAIQDNYQQSIIDNVKDKDISVNILTGYCSEIREEQEGNNKKIIMILK